MSKKITIETTEDKVLYELKLTRAGGRNNATYHAGCLLRDAEVINWEEKLFHVAFQLGLEVREINKIIRNVNQHYED